MNKFNTKDLSHYTYEVGRYKPRFGDDKKTFVPYKPESDKKLVWNVITCDFNSGKIEVRNVFNYNWPFQQSLIKIKKKFGNDFKSFAEEVRCSLQHEYWARTEYEVLISKWPSSSLYQEDLDELQKELDKDKQYNKEHGYSMEARVDYCDESTIKIDVYTQVMLNFDQFIKYLWDNKRLITPKKMNYKGE